VKEYLQEVAPENGVKKINDYVESIITYEKEFSQKFMAKNHKQK